MALGFCFPLGPLSIFCYLPGVLILGVWVGLGMAGWATNRWVLTLSGLFWTLSLGLLIAAEVVPLVKPQRLTPTFRVASLNAESWSSDLDGVGRQLVEQRPDVLVLQELWLPANHEAIQDRFPDFHSVSGGPEFTDVSESCDLVILSRRPLKRLFAGCRRPGLLVAQQDDGLTIVNVHLYRPTGGLRGMRHPYRTIREQTDTIETLMRLLEQIPGPVVVAGDFNAPARSPAVVPLAARLQDTRVAGGILWDKTFPARFPVLSLDHVFCSRELVPQSWRLLDTTSSDHRGIVLDLAREGPASSRSK
ncbi:MAG: endonuclease/exonuclease/phosphatase family protein [Vulcanimicrobiota bacterium]